MLDANHFVVELTGTSSEATDEAIELVSDGRSGSSEGVNVLITVTIKGFLPAPVGVTVETITSVEGGAEGAVNTDVFTYSIVSDEVCSIGDPTCDMIESTCRLETWSSFGLG